MTVSRQMTTDEWLEKAEYEGGALGALEYGLTHENLDEAADPEFYDLVKTAVEAWRALAPLLLDLDAAIEEED